LLVGIKDSMITDHMKDHSTRDGVCKSVCLNVLGKFRIP
jgi:hypothetical protein